jgi:two-component system phosphate regulon sensor histidine kinase PhoR
VIATRGIQWRIALSYVSLLAAVLLALGVYLVAFLREQEFRDLEAQLAREAQVVAADAVYRLATGGQESMDPLAKHIGSVTQLRVTLIAVDGQVLGESDTDPALTENHASRPEVVDALRYGIGETQRYSSTVGRDLLYVAVPMRDGDRVVGVARVALPSALLEASINRVVVAVAAALLGAALLAVALAVIIARAVALPIQALTASAQRLAQGLPHQPLPVHAGGEVGELAAAFDDMAARVREHVQSVELQRARLAAVLANIPDGVVMLDGDGAVALMNATAERLLGVDGSGAQGHTLIELTYDHELDDLGLRAIRDRSATSPVLIERGIGEQRRSIQSVAVPLPAEAASTAAALVVLQDVTELRQAEMTRRDFVANVSHELRTPVASVKAMVETLEEGALGDHEVARDFLARIHVEVDGLTRLIEELLELSRIESGRVQLRRAARDLRETVRDVIQRLQPQAERQGVTLRAATVDEPAVAFVDDERIQQVLMNLVHNAIKVTDPGGEVCVSIQRPDSRVQLIVRDNGLGIDRQDLGRLFERFYKVDKSRASGGTGLGLAIAKHLTQAHGGRIWAESAGHGQGATFTVELPLVRNMPAHEQIAVTG